MTLVDYLRIVVGASNTMFYHFIGLYSIFDFNILHFLVMSFAAIVVLRVVTHAGSSLSHSIDIPRNMYDRFETRIHADHAKDVKEDKSKE